MRSKVRNLCKTAFILTAILGSASVTMGLNTNQVKADSKTPSKIDSKTPFPEGTKQGLLLSPDAEDTPVSVKVTGDTSQKVTMKDIKPGGGTYASFNQKYGSQLASLAYDINLSGITFTAQYGVVGKTTSGDPVTAKVEMSNLTKSTAWDHATINTTQYAPGIEFSDSLYNGFDTKGIQSMDFKITFTDEKTNKDIAFNKDAYISWNSLNPNATNQYGHGHAVEAVAYLNNDGNNDSYITKDSVIEQYKSPLDSSLTLTGGATTPNQSYDTIVAEDAIGAAGFNKHSVSYPLTGTTQEFSINSLNPSLFGAAPDLSKSNGQDYWFAPSTATVFTPTPDKPNKKVVDPDTKADMNKQQVKDGQKLQYQVSQKVGYLGQDTLERYTSMDWKDKLPAQFTYKSAYLVDAKGNKVTADTFKADSKSDSNSSSTSNASSSSASSNSNSSSSSSSNSSSSSSSNNNSSSDNSKTADWAGTATFDKATNTVDYSASSDFLKAMPMNGETYTLVIDGVVDSGGKTSTLTNTGDVIIDGNSQETNTVTNNTVPPIASKLSKTVTDTSGKTGTTGNVEAGKDYAYTLTADITDKYTINNIDISDPLAAVQEYKGATVTSDGKDVTSDGTLAFDKATNTVDWKAKSPKDFSGKKLSMKITVQLKKDADLSKYIGSDGKISIPNVATLDVDGSKTPSNPTSVTPPT
ncbi:isopeptide-forming domain-containing fimbrial protein, partial [Levilactobacillus brevis]|uniref:isopeptide-forming domain-containing fimbrial protein n=1 Tax=Levilactobacillus brevis TaxID=1580 RepID=UPI00057F31E5